MAKITSVTRKTYAVSNKWVKISDLTFIDLQRHYAPYAVLVGTETNGKANISDKENLCSQQYVGEDFRSNIH